ncbi:hypothetical protein A0257_10440 [Hymenobacter psoromatis]|nr:hypothetical protein A0257_10440 [Hymenobacter psoromatis]
MDTSMMLHIAPDLVQPLAEAGSGAAKRFRVQALCEWAWAERNWSQVTADTGAGNLAAATAAKGASFLCAVAEQLGRFLVELAAADSGDMYE